MHRILPALLVVLAGCSALTTFAPEHAPEWAVAEADPDGGDAAADEAQCDASEATTTDGQTTARPVTAMSDQGKATWLALHLDDPIRSGPVEEERWSGCMGPGCPDDTVKVWKTRDGEIVITHNEVIYSTGIDEVSWTSQEALEAAAGLAEEAGVSDLAERGGDAWGLVEHTVRGEVFRHSGVLAQQGGPHFRGDRSNELATTYVLRPLYDVPDKDWISQAAATALARAGTSCLTQTAAEGRPAMRIDDVQRTVPSVHGSSTVWEIQMRLLPAGEPICDRQVPEDEWPWQAVAAIDAQTGYLHDVRFSTWDPCVDY